MQSQDSRHKSLCTGSTTLSLLAWAAGVQTLLIGIGVFGVQRIEAVETFLAELDQQEGPESEQPLFVEAEGVPALLSFEEALASEFPEVPPEPEVSSVLEVPELLPEPPLPEVPEIPEPPPLAEFDLVEALPEPEIPEPEPPAASPPAPAPKPSSAPVTRQEPSAPPSSARESSSDSGSGSGSSGSGSGNAGPIQTFSGGGGSFPAPNYPSSARRSGREGAVLLYVEVGSDGRPDEVSIARSSGHSVLDREARSTVRRWRWSSGPARYHVPVTFRLE